MALRRELSGLILFLTLLFGFMLGYRPLSVPDEGRYAEIPREMVVRGDYLTPRLNGVKYFEKPPLMYWMEAGMIKVFGLSEGVLRLLPAFLGILGCIWIFLVARLLSGREEAWSSAIILATCALYYTHTRLLILDLGVTVFLSLALFCFLLATQATSRKSQNGWLAGFYIGSALAVLTKGIIGVVIPGMILLLWTIPWKRWSYLKLAFKPWGILLFFIISAPWHILVSLKNPEFPHFYFIHEHFTRFTTTEHGRFKPWWFFLPILAAGLFPWISFLPQAIHRGSKKLSKEVFQFIGVWVGFVFIFFSVSNSKLIPYILPVFPPLALLMGVYIGNFWRENRNSPGLVWGVQIFRMLCVLMLLALPVVLYTQELLEIAELRPFLWLFALTLLAATLCPGFFVSRGRVKPTLVSIAAASITLFILLNAAWPMLENRSIKPLALKVQELRTPEDKIICYEKYYQDLPVYLNQTVMVAGWNGELAFGMKQEDTTSWMISHKKFWEIWQGQQKVYAFLPKSAFENLRARGHQMILIQQTPRDVLVTNHPF
ncbi:MAG: phospholipid carrier-dependent glycosyltransferase [Caedimonas sp.]|nr:phospholipid carrier-dependent glycosyltransferase [Caedimonas sp.]